jgi:hypothetical protein
VAVREKFIVVPFRHGRGSKIITGEIRLANNYAHAERMAESIAGYYVGATAFAVLVDDEIGEMMSPRLIVEYGQTIDLISEAIAA